MNYNIYLSFLNNPSNIDFKLLYRRKGNDFRVFHTSVIDKTKKFIIKEEFGENFIYLDTHFKNIQCSDVKQLLSVLRFETFLRKYMDPDITEDCLALNALKIYSKYSTRPDLIITSDDFIKTVNVIYNHSIEDILNTYPNWKEDIQTIHNQTMNTIKYYINPIYTGTALKQIKLEAEIYYRLYYYNEQKIMRYNEKLTSDEFLQAKKLADALDKMSVKAFLNILKEYEFSASAIDNSKICGVSRNYIYKFEKEYNNLMKIISDMTKNNISGTTGSINPNSKFEFESTLTTDNVLDNISDFLK